MWRKIIQRDTVKRQNVYHVTRTNNQKPQECNNLLLTKRSKETKTPAIINAFPFTKNNPPIDNNSRESIVWRHRKKLSDGILRSAEKKFPAWNMSDDFVCSRSTNKCIVWYAVCSLDALCTWIAREKGRPLHALSSLYLAPFNFEQSQPDSHFELCIYNFFVFSASAYVSYLQVLRKCWQYLC